MRALAATVQSATAQPITQPGYLLELQVSPLLRLSSRGDVTWKGNVFAQADLVVSDVTENPDGTTSVSVSVGNTDLSTGAIILNGGAQNAVASVWFFYQGLTGSAEPVKIFGGVVDAAKVVHREVSLQLVSQGLQTSYLPRRRICAASGFNRLLPAGRVLQLGSTVVKIERSY